MGMTKTKTTAEHINVGDKITGDRWGLKRNEPREVTSITKIKGAWILTVTGHDDTIPVVARTPIFVWS
jgi:hypothetical protein